mgnify:CR=1 FL=1
MYKNGCIAVCIIENIHLYIIIKLKSIMEKKCMMVFGKCFLLIIIMEIIGVVNCKRERERERAERAERLGEGLLLFFLSRGETPRTPALRAWVAERPMPWGQLFPPQAYRATSFAFAVEPRDA